MQIVNKSYFNKQNYLHIPLAVSNPSSVPNNATEIDFLCEKLEREILLNALGLSLYNEIKTITDIDTANEKFKKLIQGDEYDGKIWLGLDNDDSLIATQTPRYLIAAASQNFIKQYQGEYLIEPIVIDNFIDWYGRDCIEKSLYGYLMDKQADFTNWKPEYFKIYETKNSFGI
jgi:hypothetical protein